MTDVFSLHMSVVSFQESTVQNFFFNVEPALFVFGPCKNVSFD